MGRLTENETKKKSFVKNRCGARHTMDTSRGMRMSITSLSLSLNAIEKREIYSTATAGYEASSSQPQRVNGNNAISHPISDEGLFFLHLRVQMGRWWWCFNGARSFQRHWP